jgi:hypothetical protein
VFAGHYVLLGVSDNNSLMVGKTQGMLGQQLKSHPAHLLNTIIFVLIIHQIIIHWYIILLLF